MSPFNPKLLSCGWYLHCPRAYHHNIPSTLLQHGSVLLLRGCLVLGTCPDHPDQPARAPPEGPPPSTGRTCSLYCFPHCSNSVATPSRVGRVPLLTVPSILMPLVLEWFQSYPLVLSAPFLAPFHLQMLAGFLSQIPPVNGYIVSSTI